MCYAFAFGFSFFTDLYIHTSGPVTVNLSLECNTTFFRRTGIIDAGGQSSHYFSYYFGVRCVDANNSQVRRIRYMINYLVSKIYTDCVSD